MMSVVLNRSTGTGSAPGLVVGEVVREDSYLTKKELADRLKKSSRTVEKWQRLGYIPVVRVGRCVMYRWADVVEKLEERFRQCTDRPQKNKSDRAK